MIGSRYSSDGVSNNQKRILSQGNSIIVVDDINKSAWTMQSNWLKLVIVLYFNHATTIS